MAACPLSLTVVPAWVCLLPVTNCTALSRSGNASNVWAACPLLIVSIIHCRSCRLGKRREIPLSADHRSTFPSHPSHQLYREIRPFNASPTDFMSGNYEG